MATSGKPVLYADFQFGGSGGFLVYTAAFLRGHAPNVGFVASSDINDLVRGRAMLPGRQTGRLGRRFRRGHRPSPRKATPQARQSGWQDRTISSACRPTNACSGSRNPRSSPCATRRAGAEAAIAGITVERIPFAALNEAWAAADKDESRAVADRWQKERPEGRGREPRDAGGLGGDVSRHEEAAEEARCQRHHRQLPRRVLRQPHPRLSVPRLPPIEQRGPGRRLRVRRALGGHHADRHHPHPRAAGLYLRSGDRHRQAPDHLRPLRRA